MAILGCGNMGTAILDGILATLKQVEPSSLARKPIHHDHIGLSQFIACVSRPESVAALEDRYRPYLDPNAASTWSSANGRSHSPTVSVWRNDNGKAVASADVILLACQPSRVASILSDPSIRQHLHDKLLISICVGVSAARIHSLLSATDAADRHGVDTTMGTATVTEQGCYIVHAMPNTASGLGQSATVLSTGSSTPGVSPTLSLPPALQAFVTSIFRCIGTTTFVPAELMNAASVVGASTPAFFATALDGVVKGGVQSGLSESDALRLAAQAMKGTAEMVLRGMTADSTVTLTPIQIKESVMTPNGCTERGVKVMAARRVEEAMTEATSQAIDRVFKLGQEAGI
ncbi:hypothetical protein OEA41_003278 [Lepraria neglecta]|uniref:Pyrroline-5-carboxylate reductase n=1 Tax=Lepraria neglecta TaxID=209136 RepID=A0AAD9Z3Z8_9LECA|nr:hypothetical protein OEA41_003278 [Lepraria neglecta]